MTLRDTEGDEDRSPRWGGRPRPRRPPGPASAEPGDSAAGQGPRPTNGVFQPSCWDDSAYRTRRQPRGGGPPLTVH